MAKKGNKTKYINAAAASGEEKQDLQTQPVSQFNLPENVLSDSENLEFQQEERPASNQNQPDAAQFMVVKLKKIVLDENENEITVIHESPRITVSEMSATLNNPLNSSRAQSPISSSQRGDKLPKPSFQYRTAANSNKKITDFEILDDKLSEQKPRLIFQQKAIQLISWNNQKDIFEINPEAKKLVSNIQGPIGVLSVAGVYRTGKSFLLNRCFLNVQKGNGFGVGPSINPCTKGIWIWGTPIVGYTEKGQKLNILVVDSEGIGGLDEDNSHDMRIFTLALLLSSYFVYNSMGSIDENALSNINFVTNITKHIRCKTDKEQDAPLDGKDEESLIHHMPRFMWTVRDFTLQLVNDQNIEIDSKDYLESAIKDLPDTNGSQTERNLVKQHLRKYFPERDCFTMVRPVVKEENLQSMDDIPMEDLRPEFVEQIFNLRKQVIHNMKAKEVNNQQMDGSLWIALVEQYLKAMNGGTIPSIESSWTYICKNRAQSSFEQLKLKFEEALQNELTLPMNENELRNIFELNADKFKQELISPFEENEKEICALLITQVENHCSSRLTEIVSQNLSECRQLTTSTLTSLFQEVNQRFLEDSSVKTIAQNLASLELTLSEVWTLYDANVPEYSEKCLLFLNGKSQFLNDLLYFVHANLQNENQSVTQILNELQDRNNTQMMELKETFRLEKQAMETKLKETMLSKAELEATNQLLKDQYQSLKEKRDSQEQQWQTQITELKNSLQKKQEDHRKDKEEYEEQKQALNRTKIKLQSEFDKERALFDQKILFLEKSLSEKSTKEKEQINSWTSLNKELSNEIKLTISKYEAELKQAHTLLDEEREKASELEAQLQDQLARFKEESLAWKTKEGTYKELIDSTKEQVRLMEQASSQLGKESDWKAKLKEKSEQMEEMALKLKSQEERFFQVEDECKLRLNQALKDMAIREQQTEFIEIQLRETRIQLEEANKQHQSMVEAMKRQADESAKKDQQMVLANNHNGDSPSKADRLQNRVQDLQQQLLLSQEQAQELEIQLKIRETEQDSLQKEFNKKLHDLEVERNSLASKITSSTFSQNNYVKELEDKYKIELFKYEQEIEDRHMQYEADLKAVRKKSEDSLCQLKNFYEMEKEKLENRLRDERERAQKKIDEFQEEFETKMREEAIEKEEELEMLRDSLAELEQRHMSQTTQVQHELTMKQQIIDTYEKQILDQRQRIEMMESTRNQAFEKQLSFFESQRQEYNFKIDKLQSENLEKDRLLAQANHRCERQEEDYVRKEKDTKQTVEHLLKERDHLEEKLEMTKQRLSDLQDEAQQNQLIYGREQALNQQSIEFLQRKISEMQLQMEDKDCQYGSKLAVAKQEIVEEKHNQITRLQAERDNWEQKYEAKRKAMKDLEIHLNKENSELEKKLCILQENYTRLDNEKRKQEAEYQERILEAENHITQLDSTAGEAYFYGSAQAESIMQLKSNLQEYERQLNDLQSTYDKDKALWEGKCKFLETQKDNYKKDLIESQKKFEITLEQLQKRGSNQHDKYESNQNAIMKVLEGKYKNQIKEMLDSHQNLQNEVINKNKRLEEENKVLHQQLVVGKREMELENQMLRTKSEEATKLEAILKKEIQELKNEVDVKMQQAHIQQKMDKEMFKAKLQDAERKNKEADSKRSQMIFDFEKEKARWQMEYDNVLNQKRELEDIVANLERRKDLLFKENERLKAEWKANRSSADGRSSKGSESIAQLGLRLALGNNLTASIGNGLPQANNATSVLKPKLGALNQASGKPPVLGQNLNFNLTASLQGKQQREGALPPQPQKLQFQQLNLGNQNHAPQVNKRYHQQSHNMSMFTDAAQEEMVMSSNKQIDQAPMSMKTASRYTTKEIQDHENFE